MVVGLGWEIWRFGFLIGSEMACAIVLRFSPGRTQGMGSEGGRTVIWNADGRKRLYGFLLDIAIANLLQSYCAGTLDEKSFVQGFSSHRAARHRQRSTLRARLWFVGRRAVCVSTSIRKGRSGFSVT